MDTDVELEEIKITRQLLWPILVETLKGKSLVRTLMNYSLSQYELSGNILDLGSGSGSASYNRFIKYKEPFSITYADYYKGADNTLEINLEEPFDIEPGSFDRVMCFNTLEHIYNVKNVISESYKIIKDDGLFIGCVPFMMRIHPDPDDYFRFTHQALKRMFEEEGFVCQRFIYLGFGPFSVLRYPLPNALRWVSILFRILLDGILDKLSNNYKLRYPLGYVFVFKKSVSRKGSR